MPSFTDFFRRRSNSGGIGGSASAQAATSTRSQPPAVTAKADDAPLKPQLVQPASAAPAPPLTHSPPPPGLRAAITRFQGEDDRGYEDRLARIEDYLQQGLVDQCPRAPSPMAPPQLPSVAAPFMPPALLEAVTRIGNEPEDAYNARVNQMAAELGSYCVSQSYVVEHRRPDGKGWRNPATDQQQDRGV